MSLVVIHSPSLSADQKIRIGDRILEAFHAEGLHASSVVVLFKKEDADILLDGGLLIEAQSVAPATPAPREEPQGMSTPAMTPSAMSVDFKTRARRSKSELAELKGQLEKALQAHGALSSFQAQEVLGFKDCDWAPATLRRFFSELEEEGLITKQGQKRGTRYVSSGITSQVLPGAAPILVKKSEETSE